MPPEVATNSAAGRGDDDKSLLASAEQAFSDDKLLEAARFLSNVVNKSLLTDHHKKILRKADRAEGVVRELTVEPGSEWTKQGESHGKYDTVIYYKVDNSKLTARVETPIDQSLFIPLLSVFNETELYPTWIPRWEKPIRLGINKIVKLRQEGRYDQLFKVATDMPWPFETREVVIDVVAIDEIDANGAIVVKMDSPDNDPNVPPVEKGAVRVDFDGGILFRKCPKDHPSLKNSKHNTEQDMVLVCFMVYVDAKISFVPQGVINFVTRTVLGRIWKSLLDVASDVRDGKRPQHAEAIERRREKVYDHIDDRVKIMLSAMKKEPEVKKEELGEVLGFL